MSNSNNRRQFVLIVGASELVVPAYKIARDELGLGIIALDYNPESPGMIYADKSICVSTKDVDSAVGEAKTIAAQCDVVGVFTCGADVEVTVAAIAEALGLPGVPMDVALRCNDKVLMHKWLDHAGGVDKADYRLAGSPCEAVSLAEVIGFPCVIKPLDNCASRGVQRLEKVNEVEDAYDLAVSQNGDRGSEVLIESCLEGSKHTIEMIAWQGQRHLLSIIDTHYISPRWPCEMGLNTTTLSVSLQRRLFDFASKVADKIGIDFGAHKVDVNLDDKGNISLIELTARLSGGFHCQYASPLAYGSHDIRAALRLAIGEPLDFNDIEHRYDRGAAVRAVFPSPGKVVEISGIEDAKCSPGVEEVFVWTKTGAQVGPYLNSADRPAYVIAAGENTEQAIISAERAVDLVKIKTV